MRLLRPVIAIYLLGAELLLTSGCATAFVRSKTAGPPEHVFPATTFDAQFFWSNGVKGEPLFAMADSTYRNGPPTRFVYSLGAIVDLPLSVTFDSLLLPADLTRSKSPAANKDIKPDVRANETPLSNFSTNRTRAP